MKASNFSSVNPSRAPSSVTTSVKSVRAERPRAGGFRQVNGQSGVVITRRSCSAAGPNRSRLGNCGARYSAEVPMRRIDTVSDSRQRTLRACRIMLNCPAVYATGTLAKCAILIPMLERLGFFDFQHGSGDPMRHLGKEMDRLAHQSKEGLSGTLLVLPEAFNLGKPYYAPCGTSNGKGVIIEAKEALATLKQLAKAHTVVFVAGLLDRRFSAAYWIDPDSPPTLMCYKVGEDGSGNYIKGDAESGFNPVERYGASVGALICLDALACKEETEEARTRREKLVAHIKHSNFRNRIICIPAHMSSHCMPEMDGMWCVLASSGGQGSVVKDPRNAEVLNLTSRGEIGVFTIPTGATT